MKLKKVITSDNSPTLYNSELDEHYHSINGAVQESIHVFIEAAFKQITKEKISILEIGFGTGLNVILTYLENIKSSNKVYYESIEKYPLQTNILKSLQKDTIFNSVIAKKIHEAVWEENVKISNKFTLKKIQIDLLDFIPNKKFDIIYFDAFSPEKQEKLWTEEIFTKLYKATNNNGILVSYSAKGIVKQALRNSGYTVKRLPGPKGKRHMVRGIRL